MAGMGDRGVRARGGWVGGVLVAYDSLTWHVARECGGERRIFAFARSHAACWRRVLARSQPSSTSACAYCAHTIEPRHLISLMHMFIHAIIS